MVMHGHWLCLIFDGTTICPPSPDFFQLENTYLPRRVLLCLSSFTYPYALNYESTDWGSRRMDTTTSGPEFESTQRRLCLGTSSTWLLHLPGFETAGILSLSLSVWTMCVCVFSLFKNAACDVEWWVMLIVDWWFSWLYWCVFVDLIVKTQALSGQSWPFFFTKPRRTYLNIWCVYIYIIYPSTLMAYYDPFAPSKWPHVGACLIFLPWPSVLMGGSTNILW